MGAHLKKQNIFFYLSILCSVGTIVLLFLPWISFEAKDGTVTNAALFPDFVMEALEKSKLSSDDGRSMSLVIFLVPLFLATIGTHIYYIISAFRPNHDVNFPGTITVLLAGIMIIVFILGTDVSYNLLTATREEQYTDSFVVFLGIDKWTWVPVTWFLISFVQKLIFARFAHKKEVISYV